MRRKGRRWTETDVYQLGLLSPATHGDLMPASRRPERLPMFQIPLRSQPNGFTCGPTCVAMVAAAVRAPGAGLRVEQLAELAGTNPRTGTTEVEMARGLTAAGLKWIRGSATSLDQFDLELRADRIVILRTLIGGAKHWVVVEGRNADGYSIACPSVGRTSWSREQLHRYWSARQYDHFLVPAYPMAHQPSSLPIHEMTLGQFTRNATVIPDSQWSRAEHGAVASTCEWLGTASIDPLHRLPYEHDGWIFYRSPALHSAHVRTLTGNTNSMLLAREATPLTVCGGIHAGTPVVLADWRRQGGGAALVLAAHNDGPWRYLCPSSFSEGGYAARCRAHAIAVRQALESGRCVRPEVIRSNPLLRGQAISVPTPGGSKLAPDDLPLFMR